MLMKLKMRVKVGNITSENAFDNGNVTINQPFFLHGHGKSITLSVNAFMEH